MPIHKNVNKDFFKKWSPEMAYILGFFFADGSYDVTTRGAHYFSFQITDKNLLEMIRTALESDHKIAVRPPRNSRESTQYRLQIGSKDVCADLCKLGVTRQKAHTAQFPAVPRKYIGHFVRGYFDGDGNVWVGYINKKRKKPTLVIQAFFTSSSKAFLISLKDVLRQMGIRGGTLYSASAKDFSRLMLSTLDTLKLGEIMYNERPKPHLHRKKLRFDEFKKLRWYENHTTAAFERMIKK